MARKTCVLINPIGFDLGWIAQILVVCLASVHSIVGSCWFSKSLYHERRQFLQIAS